MKINFDRDTARLTVTEEASRADETVELAAALSEGESLSVTFAADAGSEIKIIETTEAEKLDEGTYRAALPAGYFDDGGSFLLGVGLNRLEESGTGSYIKMGKSSVIGFELADPLTGAEQKKLSLMRSLNREMSAEEYDTNTVSFVCDRQNNLWKVFYQGGELVKRNLTAEMDDKLSAGSIDIILQDKADKDFVEEALNNKADLNYVNVELGRKAGINEIEGKADKQEIESIAQLISNKADRGYVDTEISGKADLSELSALSQTVVGKADLSYVKSELAKKAAATALETKADRLELTSLYQEVFAKADSTYVKTELAKKATHAYVDEKVAGAGGGGAETVFDKDDGALQYDYYNGISNGALAEFDLSKYKGILIYFVLRENYSNGSSGRVYLPLEKMNAYDNYIASTVTIDPRIQDDYQFSVQIAMFTVGNTKEFFTTQFMSVSFRDYYPDVQMLDDSDCHVYKIEGIL